MPLPFRSGAERAFQSRSLRGARDRKPARRGPRQPEFSPRLTHSLRTEGLPAICIDARHGAVPTGLISSKRQRPHSAGPTSGASTAAAKTADERTLS